MNSSELKKAYQLLKRAYAEFDIQATKEGIDPTTKEYDSLKALVREKILAKMGFTLEDYQKAKEADVNSRKSTLSDVMNDGTMSVLQKTQDRVAAVEKFQADLKVPTKEEITAIAGEVAKTFVKPPQIINQIVREKTIEKPQIIRETRIEKIIEEKVVNMVPVENAIIDLRKKIETLPTVPDVEKFKEEMRSEFDTTLAKNVDIFGMPAFRKLAMGLEGRISDLERRLANSSGFKQPTSGSVDGSNLTFVWATAPNVLVVDQGRIMQKVSSDGTVNWTGTTTTILSLAPNFDIFQIA